MKEVVKSNNCKYVKCSLKDILRDSEKKSSVADAIERRCIALSQMMVKASHIFKVLTRQFLFDGGVRWMNFEKTSAFVDMCTIKIGAEGDNNENKKDLPNDEIGKVWREYFVPVKYPPGERYPRDYYTLYTGAHQLKKTIEKQLKSVSRRFQKLAIEAHLDETSADKRLFSRLLKLLNDESDNIPPSLTEKKHVEFVRNHALSLARGGINDHLSYCKYIIEKYNVDAEKICSFLTPRVDIKIYHAAIDTKVVKGLCEQVDVVIFNENATDDDIWSLLFDAKKINRLVDGRWEFDRFISTDGVSCSVRFRQYRDNESKDATVCETNRIKSVIGIDPGKKVVMACAEINLRNGRVVRQKRLTRKSFVKSSGVIDYNRQLSRWIMNDELYYRAIRELSLFSHATSILDYIAKYSEWYRVLWGFTSKKEIREKKYEVCQATKKTLDDFAKSVIDNRSGTRIQIACGNNVTSQTNKDCLKAIKRQIGKENIRMVDEFNTSKVCHACFSKFERGALLMRKNRREKCSYRKCPNYGKDVDRDTNAAINIAKRVILPVDCRRAAAAPPKTRWEY